MLLNHKNAIEFMVDAVPTEGIAVPAGTVESMPREKGRALVEPAPVVSSKRREIPTPQLRKTPPATCCRRAVVRHGLFSVTYSFTRSDR